MLGNRRFMATFRLNVRSIVMIRALKGLIPLLILCGCIGAAWWLYVNQPELKQRSQPPTYVRVEGTVLRETTYPLRVKAQGTVQPRTRSTLLPEVPGRIVKVSDSFRPGGFFAEDEILLELDPVDFETAVTVAEASLAQANLVLAEEEARAAQAAEDWRDLGRTGEIPPLVARLPQLAKTRADVSAAEAQVEQARRNLDRTRIRAPYEGQVIEQAVDVGQYVSQGTTLGRIFATDYVEVRLSLPEQESRFLDLPHSYRGESSDLEKNGLSVVLLASVAGEEVLWEGRLVRVESGLDEQTRQAVAVARVSHPYTKREDGRPPLLIGTFVQAEIDGGDLDNVFVIPRSAVRAGNEIILISPENTLRRATVKPLVSNADHVVVRAESTAPVKEGDVLCVTPIPFPADGARVIPTIDGEAPPRGVAGPPPKEPATVTTRS